MKHLASAFVIAVIVFIFLAAGDTIRYAYMSVISPLRVYPGLDLPVSGELRLPVDDVFLADSRQPRIAPNAYNDFLRRFIVFDSPSSGLALDFEELHGRLWRGVLRASARMEPGEHVFYVSRRVGDAGRKMPYLVQVYPNRSSWQAAAPSLSERHLGVKPWWLIVGAFPPLTAAILFLAHLSGREQRALLARGIAPVRRLVKRNEWWEITFDMGSEHGVHAGEEMNVLDESLRPVGCVRVKKTGPQLSLAVLSREQPISHRHYVARKAVDCP